MLFLLVVFFKLEQGGQNHVSEIERGRNKTRICVAAPDVFFRVEQGSKKELAHRC